MPSCCREAGLAVIGGLLLALATAGAAQAQDPDAARQQLQQLEQEIARISAAQREREASRGAVQQQLREAELRLQALQKELASLAGQIDLRSRELAGLEQRRGELEAAAQSQRAAVAAELRRAFRDSDDDQLKMLLSQEDPQSLARMLTYYRYLLDARSRLLEEFQATLDELDALQEQVAATRETLRARREQIAQRRREVDTAQRERAGLLAEIDAAIASDSARLEERQADRARLEQLLEDIEAAMAAVAVPADVQPFSAARGQMPWPVDGVLAERFGAPRNQGKMRWQGVRLRADAGETVRAIHHGRVVFADWLRGSGLLLVIDHGEGFMSLYAHNATLLREVGDWVSTGAAVSTVGDSGGQSEAALYFEIRKDGKPTDPTGWCRG